MNNNMENIGLLNKLGIGKYLKKVKEYVDANTQNIETTYDNLVNLRNNSQLIPGQQYRITDYVTTTNQPLTMSAGHQFDIIVTADSENTLNEKARACMHKRPCDISKYNICYLEGSLEQPLNFVQDYTYNDKTYRLYRHEEFEILIDFFNLIAAEDYEPNTFNFAVVSNYIKYPEDNDWTPWPDSGDIIEFEFDPYLVYPLIYPYQKAYNLSEGCNVNYIEDYEYLGNTYNLYEDDNEVQYLMDFTKHRNVIDIDLDFKYGVFPDFRRQTSEDDWEIGIDYETICFKYNPNDSEKYFSKNKLEAWEIWYSLDNDMTRFEWANNYLSPETNKKMLMVNDDVTTCKGTNLVFVRNEEYDEDGKCAWLIDDEWSYDGIGDEGTFRFYVRNGVETLNDSCIIFTENENPNIGDILMSTDESFFKLTNISVGTGVIYRMIDEFGNDCPYDFKNILYIRNMTFDNGPVKFDESGEPTWVYTFSGQSYNIFHDYYSNSHSSEYMLDGSLLSPYSFYSDELTSQTFTNNIIKPYIKAYDDFGVDEIDTRKNIGRLVLNDIVMLGWWEEIGSEEDEYYLYYSYCCYSNSFGNNCRYNSLGNYCQYNSFGNDCYENSFGNSCWYNSFGNVCYGNSFGNSCYGNSFGNGCTSNSFGDSCDSNSFGNSCYDNSFGEICASNSFGDNCAANSFGNGCTSNSFGNRCYNNSFRVSAVTAGSLKNYVQYNHFDDGCSYNVIWNGDTTSSVVLLKNINVNRGVCGTSSSYNMINIDVLNQDYELQIAKNSNGEIKIYCEADLIA